MDDDYTRAMHSGGILGDGIGAAMARDVLESRKRIHPPKAPPSRPPKPVQNGAVTVPAGSGFGWSPPSKHSQLFDRILLWSSVVAAVLGSFAGAIFVSAHSELSWLGGGFAGLGFGLVAPGLLLWVVSGLVVTLGELLSHVMELLSNLLKLALVIGVLYMGIKVALGS